MKSNGAQVDTNVVKVIDTYLKYQHRISAIDFELHKPLKFILVSLTLYLRLVSTTVSAHGVAAIALFGMVRSCFYY